ncbi:NUDIX hydrolase [Candidatus Bathyarchaeota archaeon]|nr:NUDIX hydrolase [Candidatus Bathyarchaeota archaeon]
MISMERLVSSRRVYDGKIINLRVDQVKLPDGSIHQREIVEHPGAVAILPILDDDRILLIRQYRHAVGEILLEIPAGTLKRGEEPRECARRELLEETGYVAESMSELFNCYLAPGYSSERIHIYQASRLRMVGSRMDVDEHIDLEPVTLHEVEAMIRNRKIRDAKTIAAVTFYLWARYWGES